MERTDEVAQRVVTRRGVLGGLGGLGLGAGIVALGGVEPAGAADRPMTEGLAGAPTAVTALNPALRYIVASGYDLQPIDSTQTYDTDSGRFRFTGASSGNVSLQVRLPVGAVIKEIEVYGTRSAAGLVTVTLWQATLDTGGVADTASAIVPAVAGGFTVTLAANDTVSTTKTSTPFVFISSTAASTTSIYGIRVGYTSPTGFVPLPSGTDPRVYDTRQGGLTKLQPNEERTISLPVPAAAGAAIFTLTLTNTEGTGGYVAAFRGGITWPGNSSVNFSGAKQDVANTVVCAVNSSSQITLRGGGAATDVIVDVTGWIV